ncbi:MAG: type I methionyl aminopeptidase [Clostridia bacterium]|nr:type I methionyl aminopeptidase [Clostridia bacterium]
MINLKTKSDIEAMAESGQILAKALEAAEEAVKPGMTTERLNEIVEKVILREGAKPSCKNYQGFPACCCISPNNVVVHGIPSRSVVLKEGDIVSVDSGAYYKGFHSDAARTFAVGKISEEAKRLIEVTRACFFAGAKMAVDGNRVGDIGSAIQQMAEEAGYGVVRELVGHGVGRSLHESPDVPNFGRAGKGVRLTRGMVIAIEPMINMGAADVRFSKTDGWTVTTLDGSLSAHYENTVAITEDGPKILTLR